MTKYNNVTIQIVIITETTLVCVKISCYLIRFISQKKASIWTNEFDKIIEIVSWFNFLFYF